jgi:hypothetical protein
MDEVLSLRVDLDVLWKVDLDSSLIVDCLLLYNVVEDLLAWLKVPV